MTSPLSRDLNYRLTADPDRLEAGFRKGGKAGNALERELRKLEFAQKRVDQEAAKLAKGMETVAVQMDTTGRDAGTLDRRIAASTVRIRQLAAAIDEAGDEIDQVTLEKAFRGEQAALRRLQNLKRALQEVADEAEEAAATTAVLAVGRVGGEGLLSALQALPAQLRGALIVSLVAAATVASPIIGAAVGSAVLGVTGAGGIAGGIALAARDARVKAAAGELADVVGAAFLAKGEAFVQPTIRSLALLADAGKEFAEGLKLGGLADELVPLSVGLAGLGREVLPGLNSALEAARPLIRVVARELPEVGRALSDMFESIAEDSDGAILALAFMFDLIKAGARATGEVIAFLELVFHDIVDFAKNASGVLEDVFKFHPLIGPKITDVNDRTERWLDTLNRSKRPIDEIGQAGLDAFGQMAGSAGDLADQIKKVREQADKLFDTTMALVRAPAAFQAALDDLREAVKENGKAIDITTEKGRNLQHAFLEGVDVANAWREAQIKAGVDPQVADAAYAQRIKVLRDLAVQLGIDRTKVDALLVGFKLIPAQTTAVVTVLTDQALAAIAETRRELARLQDRTIRITVVGGGGKLFAFQHGGQVDGPPGIDRTLIAATKGEFVSTVAATSRNRAALEAANAGARLFVTGATAAAGSPAGGAAGTAAVAGVDERSLAKLVAREVAYALNGVTISVDDRGRGRVTAVEADLYGRGG